MRAVIYLRLSMDRTGEHAGVDRQRDDCIQLAADLGWTVTEVFTDNDISATSGKPRPDYRRMLAAIDAGQVDAVIAWHTDRLYRRLPDLEEFATACEANRVAVRTVRAGELDMSTPTGRMLARILGSVAAYEVEQKADRWQRSIAQRRESGKWWNSANRMFGYTRDGEIVPDEAEALRRVARHILDGSTVHSACRMLAADGFTSTRGREWLPSSLRQTLRSPKIAGLSALRGEIIGAGEWEPILDRDVWERVVAAIATRNPQTAKPRRSLLGGYLWCGVDGCGRKLTRGKTRTGPVYRCKTELQAFGHVTIAASTVEDLVESYARAKLADDRVRRALAVRVGASNGRASELTREIDELDSRLSGLERELADAQGRTASAIVRAMTETEHELGERRRQLAVLTPVVVPLAGEEWPDDIERRSALIGLVVAHVWVRPTPNRGGRFDPSRVRVVPRAAEQLELDQQVDIK